MVTGAETPLVSGILAGAQPGQARAVSDSKASSEQRSVLPEPTDIQPTDLSRDVIQISNTAVDLAQNPPNFEQAVEDLQNRIADEDRLPPSIFSQMKKLLEAALTQESGQNINKVA